MYFDGLVVVLDLPLLHVAVEGSDNPISLENSCQVCFSGEGEFCMGDLEDVFIY